MPPTRGLAPGELFTNLKFIANSLKSLDFTQFVGQTIKKLKAAPRFELGVKILQTSALPLGYAAMSGQSL